MDAALSPSRMRLAALSLPAKLIATFFLLLVGMGYLVALHNIREHQHDADGKPGLSLNDLRRTYHGLWVPSTAPRPPSPMLVQVRPGGGMRRHLEKGGDPAVRSLVGWLEAGAAEATFAKSSTEAGDPSPKAVIAAQCIRCHNADGGAEEDVPYAATAEAEPDYAMVAKLTAPPAAVAGDRVWLAPMDQARLTQVTHAHILSMPVFTLAVAALFLATGLSMRVKLLVGPLPMLALCLDIASWWLARPFESFIYVIAASGALFGAAYGFQILAVFCSMWFGKKTGTVATKTLDLELIAAR